MSEPQSTNEIVSKNFHHIEKFAEQFCCDLPWYIKDEVIQASAVRLLRLSFTKLKGIVNLKGYIKRTVKNSLCDYFRMPEERRKRKLKTLTESIVDHRKSEAVLIQEEIARMEEEKVKSVLAKQWHESLDELDKRLIELKSRFVTIKSIANELKISVRTVTRRIRSLKEEFRAALALEIRRPGIGGQPELSQEP